MIFLMLTILKALANNGLVLKTQTTHHARLFLMNRSKYFRITSPIETGISDFLKLVVTVLKMFYKKQKKKIMQYRSYKNFNKELIRIE